MVHRGNFPWQREPRIRDRTYETMYLAGEISARGLRTRRYRNPTNVRPASLETLDAIALECDVAIIALSD